MLIPLGHKGDIEGLEGQDEKREELAAGTPPGEATIGRGQGCSGKDRAVLPQSVVAHRCSVPLW